MTPRAQRLPAYALFAALLSAAGLPIYIHAPKFYVDEYGVSLAALATVLFVLRLLDVVQDPLLGKLSERLRHHRGSAVAVGAGVMALSMVGLFAVTPPVSPLLWFGGMLTLVFSSFSFLTICFYAQGVAKAKTLAGNGHIALARWRETGALLGVCVASVTPVALGVFLEAPFAGFAVGFAVLAIAAAMAMRAEWRPSGVPAGTGFATILRDSVARRLLLVALVNAAPVAVSSTLFLFYVEIALEAPGWEGALLLLFFLSAAVAAPFWGAQAARFGPKPVLLVAMVLGIAAFGGALFLGAGDQWLFALVCIASGAVLGADLTLLPAMFANRMSQIAPSGAEGFGLWSFVSKFTLALAAIALLPVLEGAGLQTAGGASPDEAVSLLIWFYAGVPCLLKVLAILLLSRVNVTEDP
ncbi:MFS transporter [Sulfitobacter aestuariivivens]|uniref:MFS transporter n=1 Tax=Sulfitobacter aestuariivivens TaxID=2766981 RepID=A0A927D610_9RHOB|nr:MFS transporter [Sulfitobacter aestuariivivens]MBD3665778.1 MFS transporter [Sulfitobacter aestuariivivens]